MQEIDQLHKQFTEICNSIDKSSKQCIINLQKLQDNISKELFDNNCTTNFSNEPENYGDKHGI